MDFIDGLPVSFGKKMQSWWGWIACPNRAIFVISPTPIQQRVADVFVQEVV